MENNQHNHYRINPAIMAAVIFQLVFLFFAVISIRNLLESETKFPKIEINNFSTIPAGKIIYENNDKSNTQNVDFNLKPFKNDIEKSIYDIALTNNKGNIKNNGAEIREGSAHYVYIEDLNIYFLGFIVDIEDLKQSYRFAWGWANDPSGQLLPTESMMVFCLREDEMIYGKFNCKDDYNGSGLDWIVYNLLSKKMFSNFTVGLSGVFDGKPLTFSINVGSDNESAKNAAIKEVSDYLAELGFNLDDYEYNIRYIGVASQTSSRYLPLGIVTAS